MVADTVSRLLPLRSDARPTPDDGARIVGIDEAAASDVFEALSSNTTRSVLAAIYDEPGTASEIADRVGTSLQNATYHLDKLQGVDLIEVADTWYSEHGNEMKVYAPTNESVVVLAGDESTRSTLREALARLLGACGALAAGSLVVESVVRVPDAVYFDADGGESAPSLLPSAEVGGWLSPGVLFFVGGVFVVSILLAWSVAVDR